MKRNPAHIPHLASVFLLLGIIAYQIRKPMTQSFLHIAAIRKNFGQSAVWRGANFFSQDFANFVGFLHQEVPINAKIIIPPRGISPYPLSSTQYMQYFLYPRSIVNCSGDYVGCVNDFLGGSTSYLIIVQHESISELSSQFAPTQYRELNGKFGFLTPVNFEEGAGQALQTYAAFEYFLIDFFLGNLFLLAIWFAGILYILAWFPRLDKIFILALGFGFGTGTLSILLTIPLILGELLSRGWVLGVLFFMIATAVGAYLMRGGRNGPIHFALFDFGKQEKWILPGMIWGVVMIILAIGLGYHRDDALWIWAPKGYGIALVGFPDGPTNWGTLTTEYPLHIPMLIAGMRQIFAENLPESKLLFPYFTIATMLVVYAYFRQKLPGIIAGLAVLVVATSPIFFDHSFIAYANLASTYLFLAGILVLGYQTRANPGQVSFLVLGSILLALSAWTRPELLLLATIAILAYWAWNFRKDKFSNTFLPLGIPMAAFWLYWEVTRRFAYAQSGIASSVYRDAFHAILRGKLNFGEAARILDFLWRSVLSLNVWGLLGWSILIGFAALIFSRRNASHLVSWEYLVSCIFILGICGGYYLISFNSAREHSIEWWLSSGLKRMIMPGLILLWVLTTREALLQFNRKSL